MMACMESETPSNTIVFYTIFALSPFISGSGPNHFSLERFKLFNAGQRVATRAFLEYIRDRRFDSNDSDDAAEALDSYWFAPNHFIPTKRIRKRG